MIFSGIEVLFFVLGNITALSVMALIYFHKKMKFKWPSWVCLILGAFLLIFGLAWSLSSILESESRAASMGMLFFILPSVLLIIAGIRIAGKKGKA